VRRSALEEEKARHAASEERAFDLGSRVRTLERMAEEGAEEASRREARLTSRAEEAEGARAALERAKASETAEHEAEIAEMRRSLGAAERAASAASEAAEGARSAAAGEAAALERRLAEGRAHVARLEEEVEVAMRRASEARRDAEEVTNPNPNPNPDQGLRGEARRGGGDCRAIRTRSPACMPMWH
jgi:chromosome segregation ATPase